MTDFIVLLSIGNILVSENTKKRLGKKAQKSRALGVVTTKHVTASNRKEAVELARHSAESELRSSYIAPILNELNFPLSFELEGVREKLIGGDVLPGRGFTFFLEPPSN